MCLSLLSRIRPTDFPIIELGGPVGDWCKTLLDDVTGLVQNYFSYGFQQKEILLFLKLLHKKIISGRTLRRILAKSNLYRRKKFSPIGEVVQFLQKEINKSGQLHGYKWMHLRCIQNNLVVPQEVVRELLHELDPKGIEMRKRKRLRRRQYHNNGPNYLWHLDSYDKLKPYGICINGCIDGFSRHIIWLNVGPTSSDPKVVDGYFVRAIEIIGGFPKTIRSDMGTENKTVEHFQNTLHELFTDKTSERPPFLYGKSTHNQRIECWWSILRKHNAQFWMNLFENLKDEDLFDGSYVDKSLIQFCFANMIQKEIDEVVIEWNVHRISKSRNSISPCGRPTIMFEMPSLYNAKDYLSPVPRFALDVFHSECTFHKYSCEKDFYDLCKILIHEHGFQETGEPDGAVELYVNLRCCLKSLLV